MPRSGRPSKPSDRVKIRKKSKKQLTRAQAIGLANLKKGGGISVGLFNSTKPKITPALASTFVKLLASGFTVALALDQMFPHGHPTRPRMNGPQLKLWRREWVESPLVLDATNEWNGGAWEDLDHDRQITVALDHLDAQMARFLYTTDYNTADAPLGKIADARSALIARIKAKDGDESPFEQAMRNMLEGKIKGGPPQLQDPLTLPPPAKSTH